jgi:protoporphyrinogen oxidase
VTIVVLGAGPAGLAAGWWAARDGHDVVVLERAKEPGGMAASFDVAGVRVDHGSHRLHPTIDPAILAELTGAGLELQVRARNGRLRLADRWLAFPLRTGDLVRHLPAGFVVRAGLDAVVAPLRRPRADTFAEVVRAGLGPTMGERFYFPYATKLFGAPPQELSGELARRRIGANSPARLLGRVLGRGQAAGGSHGQPAGRGTFLYPPTGFGAIPEVLASAAVGAGADVRCGWSVDALTARGDGWAVAATDPDGGAAGIDASAVWSTVPVPALARLLGAPDDVAAAAEQLRARGMILVYLVVERDRWTPFDAHYLPSLATPVSRVSEPKGYRDGDDPVGRTVLCAELPASPGDEHWAADDDALARRVVADLTAVGLPPVEPSAVVVRRLPAAYPVYDLGWDHALGAVERWIECRPGITSFGRHGLHAHDNTHHALASARALVDCLRPDGTIDPVRWRAARATFATHVVED